jgi:hypothetical protein
VSHQVSPTEMQRCIENCLDCHRSCLQTATICLQHGGHYAAAQQMTLLLDCAQISLTSADFMLRQSPRQGQICRICADVCTRCAEECERTADEMLEMRECAEVCRRCARSCQQMSA